MGQIINDDDNEIEKANSYGIGIRQEIDDSLEDETIGTYKNEQAQLRQMTLAITMTT